jgi:hypothetical protein
MQQMNPLLGGIINPNMRFVRDQCKENRRPKNGFLRQPSGKWPRL